MKKAHPLGFFRHKIKLNNHGVLIILGEHFLKTYSNKSANIDHIFLGQIIL